FISWPILLGMLCGYFGCLALLPMDHLPQRVFLMFYCNVVWTLLGCYLFHSVPLPIFYFVLLLTSLIFYLGLSSPEKDPRSTNDPPRIQNIVFDLLKSFNQEEKEEIECGEVEQEVEEDKEEEAVVSSSTPAIGGRERLQPPSSAFPETPIAHPGVSALIRNDHPSSNRRRPSRLYSSLGGGSAHRPVRVLRRDSTLGDPHPNHSDLYISWVLWACCIAQLWVHPRLLKAFDLNAALEEKTERLFKVLASWYASKEVYLVPAPFRVFGRNYFKAEKRALALLPEFADLVVTGFLLMSLICALLFTGIFVSFQLYHECMTIVQTSGEIVSKVSNSSLFQGLGSLDGAESYVETAYTQGRSYISNFLQTNNISEKDNGEFERDVLLLFDRMYQYWLDRNSVPAEAGPRMNEEALASTVEDLASKVKNNFSFALISSFAQENMGMITSVLEHAWGLLKGNLGIMLSLLAELLSVLLNSGSGLFNFILGLVVYFTALFYLLSASDRSYIPLVVISELSVMGDDFAMAMNKAIKSVFIITFKMASFYGLWTYLTHTLFSASIVMVPVLAATFLAAVPLAGQYLVAIPAALELIFAKERLGSAFLLVLCHFAPMCLVDASIYAEVKRGIHPWITGLTIYGPLIVCAVYVVLTVYTGFMALEHPAENIGSTTHKTPNIKRSDTVL
ncbi:Transmembrane protein C9orf5like, partial [Caligus rogercresseyi]